MPERENLHTNAHTSRLREQTRTTLNYAAKDKRYAQTSDFAWAYNDVWAVPEIEKFSVAVTAGVPFWNLKISQIRSGCGTSTL